MNEGNFVLKLMNDDGTVAEELRFGTWAELSSHYEGIVEEVEEDEM